MKRKLEINNVKEYQALKKMKLVEMGPDARNTLERLYGYLLKSEASKSFDSSLNAIHLYSKNIFGVKRHVKPLNTLHHAYEIQADQTYKSLGEYVDHAIATKYRNELFDGVDPLKAERLDRIIESFGIEFSNYFSYNYPKSIKSYYLDESFLSNSVVIENQFIKTSSSLTRMHHAKAFMLKMDTMPKGSAPKYFAKTQAGDLIEIEPYDIDDPNKNYASLSEKELMFYNLVHQRTKCENIIDATFSFEISGEKYTFVPMLEFKTTATLDDLGTFKTSFAFETNGLTYHGQEPAPLSYLEKTWQRIKNFFQSLWKESALESPGEKNLTEDQESAKERKNFAEKKKFAESIYRDENLPGFMPGLTAKSGHKHPTAHPTPATSHPHKKSGTISRNH